MARRNRSGFPVRCPAFVEILIDHALGPCPVPLAARIVHNDVAIACGADDTFSQVISRFRRSHSASIVIGAKKDTAVSNRVMATRI